MAGRRAQRQARIGEDQKDAKTDARDAAWTQGGPAVVTTRVLIALDDSKAAVYVAHEALRLLGSAQVDYLVINVTRFPIAWADTSTFGAVMPMTALPSLPSVEEREAEARNRLAQHALDAGVPVTAVLEVTGDPATEICAAAVEHRVDLIVVGAHHRNILQRLLVPSVSTDVLKSSSRPVLVIPAA